MDGQFRRRLMLTVAMAVLCIGARARAAELHVPADHASVQDAIDAASDGDTVVVAPGTYEENIDFLGKAITVTGTDPENPGMVGATVLDGGGRGSVVVFAGGESADSVLRGLTVRGGKAEIGGGVLCEDSSPTIARCVIAGNTAYRGGGIACRTASPHIHDNWIMDNTGEDGGAGIDCEGECSPLIEGNLVLGNVAGQARVGGGIALHGAGEPRVLRNTVSHNTRPYGPGAGIGVGGPAATVMGNVITDNATGMTGQGRGNCAGGGVFIGTQRRAPVVGNYIARNSAYWMGGGIYVAGNSHGHIRMAGNTIHRNHTDSWGGGLMLQGTNIELVSNAITYNSAGKTGGGVAIPAGSGSFTGNTVAWNEGDGLRIISDSRWRLSRNDIYGNSGLGIELEEDGPTPNDEDDADEGANGLQNYPVLSAASSDDSSTTVAGTLSSTPDAEFTIEFFANDEVDPSGYGEGQRYIGSTTVTTDAEGEAVFEVTLPVVVEKPDLITATATSAGGHTSEFSRPVGRRTGRGARG